jgi:hypothetical protein
MVFVASGTKVQNKVCHEAGEAVRIYVSDLRGLGPRDLLALAEAIELMLLSLVGMRSHGVVTVGD